MRLALLATALLALPVAAAGGTLPIHGQGSSPVVVAVGVDDVLEANALGGATMPLERREAPLPEPAPLSLATPPGLPVHAQARV
ncbi:MAG TPA: hypothetical protein VHH36_05175, partial [Candidatus Thermoplasmatota archaeon]|nr:hypothetical protein [Candidatus Thermoplasmatota archaeon]